jgi:hypothetical protein
LMVHVVPAKVMLFSAAAGDALVSATARATPAIAACHDLLVLVPFIQVVSCTTSQ